jgi:hypothetical protein
VVVVITVHLFHGGGEREVVLLAGDGVEARQAARAFCWERVGDDSDVYRAALVDPFSTRHTFDTDATWYRPVAA